MLRATASSTTNITASGRCLESLATFLAMWMSASAASMTVQVLGIR